MFSLTTLQLRVSTTLGLGIVVMVEAAVVVVAVAVAAVPTLVVLMVTVLMGDNVGTTNVNKRASEIHNNIKFISIHR